MSIRRLGETEIEALRELWEEFEREVPEMPHRGEATWDGDVDEIRDLARSGLVLLAEDDAGPAGYALAKLEDGAERGDRRICLLDSLYVRPRTRQSGLAKALMVEVAAWGTAQGARTMTLEVLTSNHLARSIYERLGFREESRIFYAPLAELEPRLADVEPEVEYGSIHVQTDDVDGVIRAVRQFVPRLPGGSRGSAVSAPANGWTSVYDELCDREPAMLRRLAVELSDRMGAVVLGIGIEESAVVRYVLLERGRVMDEYASLPEYHGPLPPGDVIALAANPTVVQRLTGADPRAVRETARTAETAAELPPAPELLAELGGVLGVPGAAYGYEAARTLPGVTLVERT
jgi:ribosomal protein S18 acetylase RimI-like enzyme